MSLKVNIKKRLGNFNLDVAFETERGVFAILGASGCGKSMTLKCIAGIETPDEGRIELNGRVLYGPDRRRPLPADCAFRAAGGRHSAVRRWRTQLRADRANIRSWLLPFRPQCAKQRPAAAHQRGVLVGQLVNIKWVLRLREGALVRAQCLQGRFQLGPGGAALTLLPGNASEHNSSVTAECRSARRSPR